jgi:hypothetical protein
MAFLISVENLNEENLTLKQSLKPHCKFFEKKHFMSIQKLIDLWLTNLSII